MKKPHADSIIVDRLGGSSATARMCDVTPQAVSQWKKDGIPKSWRAYLELAHPEAFSLIPTKKSLEASHA